MLMLVSEQPGVYLPSMNELVFAPIMKILWRLVGKSSNNYPLFRCANNKSELRSIAPARLAHADRIAS
jgi:hypothetical protein